MKDALLKARVGIALNMRFFASIMYEKTAVHTVTPGDTWRGVACETAFTDGRNIVINEQFFLRLAPSERVFLLCHEIYHVFARHPSRAKHYRDKKELYGQPYDHELMNIAMDAVINKALRDCNCGTMPSGGVDLTKELYGLGHKLTGLEAPEEIYKLLLENDVCGPRGPGGDSDDPANGKRAKHNAMASDVGDPATAAEDGGVPSEAEMRASIATAAMGATRAGSIPGAVQVLIDSLLEVKSDWREVLRSTVTALGTPDTYTWSRPNRRKLVSPGVYMPRRVGTHCGHVVVAIDTSGSVSDKVLQMFLSETSAILSDVHPSELSLIWCDYTIDRVDEMDQPEDLLHAVRVTGVNGRGGTRFSPPFDYIATLPEPPAYMIYMTDGYAPFPTRNIDLCPTIWAMSTNVEAPFGTNIKLEMPDG